MPLFEVALVELPKSKKAREDGEEEKLIYGPKAVMAANEQAAAIAAVRSKEVPAEMDYSRLQVLIRPFAEGQQS